MKFYKCEICGKIVAMVKDTPIETVCCGQDMVELVPGTTDGSTEHHVPVYRVEGDTVTVRVGAKEHPMTENHAIEWIAIETTNGSQCRRLKPTGKPCAKFALVPYEKVKNVYDYCIIHGLWKA